MDLTITEIVLELQLLVLRMASCGEVFYGCVAKYCLYNLNLFILHGALASYNYLLLKPNFNPPSMHILLCMCMYVWDGHFFPWKVKDSPVTFCTIGCSFNDTKSGMMSSPFFWVDSYFLLLDIESEGGS